MQMHKMMQITRDLIDSMSKFSEIYLADCMIKLMFSIFFHKLVLKINLYLHRMQSDQNRALIDSLLVGFGKYTGMRTINQNLFT